MDDRRANNELPPGRRATNTPVAPCATPGERMPPMIATVFAWIVVALHLLFAAGESVGWSQMARRFGFAPDAIEHTRALALNQGAYNAGIAVLLGWALV